MSKFRINLISRNCAKPRDMLHLNTENKFNQLWTNQLQACWSKKQELLIMCLSHATFCCLFNGRNLRKMDLFSRNGQSNSRVYWLWWFIYFPVLLVDLFVKYYWVSFSQLTCWSHCFSSAGILLCLHLSLYVVINVILQTSCFTCKAKKEIFFFFCWNNWILEETEAS